MTSQELLMQRARADANRRWWAIAAILGLTVVVNQNRAVSEFWPLLSVLGGAMIYNFLFSLFAYRQHVSRFWLDAEIALDLTLIWAITYFTGGLLASPFFFLFPLLMIIQTWRRDLRGLASVVAGTLAACAVLGLLSPVPWSRAWPQLLDRCLILFGVAATGLLYIGVFQRELGRVQIALQAREQELTEASTLNEKLQTKIKASTQKWEDANLMLVKKNLAMMAFHEIYVAMNNTRKSKHLLDLVMDTAMSLMNPDAGFLLLVDPTDKKLHAEVSRGLDRKHLHAVSLMAGQSLEAEAVRTQREQYVSDLARAPHYSALSVDAKSKMCAPLRSKNKIRGVITVESARVDAFAKGDLELLITLASQASEVLQNLDLYEQMQHKASGLSTLFEIGKDISTILNLKELLATILERALKVIKARGGALMLYSSLHSQLVIRAASGLPPETAKGVRVDAGIVGRVFQREEPVLIPNASEHEWYDPDTDRAYAGQSLLACPLAIRRKKFGVICLNDRPGRLFNREELQLLGALASQAAIAIENVELYASIRRDYLNAIKALAAAVDAKDHYTHGHSNKVMAYSAMIAKELGLGTRELEKIKYGALLHDIGKIGISESVLNKPSKLTPKEFDTIAMHPILGVSIVQNIESLKDLIPIILYHHERYSGGGYPEGIAANSIPLGARIVGVADSWDVMTSDRAYRKALPLDVAVTELKKCAGTQFDPEVVAALLRALERNEKIDAYKIEDDAQHFTLDDDEIGRLMD